MKNWITLDLDRQTTLHLGILTALMLGSLASLPDKASAQFLYSGINRTTMQFPDVFGNPGPPQLFQTSSVLSFGAPLQVVDPLTGTVTRENNPFNLSIVFGSSQEALATGALTLVSATETSGLTGGTFLQQFWQLAWVDNVTFQGVFTDSGFGNLANQPNLINAPMPLPGGIDVGAFPFPLASGTELVGQFTPDRSQVRVRVTGNTTDLARPFIADITAAFAGQLQPDIAVSTDVTVSAAIAPVTMTIAMTDAIAETTAVPEPRSAGGLALSVIVSGLAFLNGGLRSRPRPTSGCQR